MNLFNKIGSCLFAKSDIRAVPNNSVAICICVINFYFKMVVNDIAPFCLYGDTLTPCGIYYKERLTHPKANGLMLLRSRPDIVHRPLPYQSPDFSIIKYINIKDLFYATVRFVHAKRRGVDVNRAPFCIFEYFVF